MVPQNPFDVKIYNTGLKRNVKLRLKILLQMHNAVTFYLISKFEGSKEKQRYILNNLYFVK
jgi:hypothetical protein